MRIKPEKEKHTPSTTIFFVFVWFLIYVVEIKKTRVNIPFWCAISRSRRIGLDGTSLKIQPLHL